MKVLLVNPPANKTIHASIPEQFYEFRGTHPPLGLLYLASYLQKKKPECEIKVYDMEAEKNSPAQLEEKIKEFSPDVVGVQVFSLTILNALDVLRAVKKLNKEIITVVGGPHLALYPVETISFENIDYGIIGEGEITLYELVDAIEKKQQDFSKICGLAYKLGGQVIINEKRQEIENLDEIPLIDRSLLKIERYSSYFTYGKKNTNIATSRGCPYDCIFCCKTSSNFRPHSVKYVLADIKNCLNLKIKEIFAVDDTFSLDIERAKEICREIIDQKLDFDWYINTRINTVDDELLCLLKKAGCRQINYGIESGSQKILDGLKKNINVSEAKKRVRATQKAGIKTLCYFMIGLPGETKKELNLTIQFIKETKPSFVRFSVTTLNPGTELYRLGLKKGIIKQDVWRNFAKNPREDFTVPVWTEHFSREELYGLFISISKKYYLSPNYVIRSALDINNWINFRKNFGVVKKIIGLNQKSFKIQNKKLQNENLGNK